jgi:hypothetical protein
MPSKKTTSDRNTAIDYINRDIINVKEDLANISKIVRDGNGHPSLMQQVATLNNDVTHLRAEIDSRFNETRDLMEVYHNEMYSAINKCDAKHAKQQGLHWHMQTAIWVALISSVTDLLIHFFGK